MEKKGCSQGRPSSSFPRKTPRGVQKGNEQTYQALLLNSPFRDVLESVLEGLKSDHKKHNPSPGGGTNRIPASHQDLLNGARRMRNNLLKQSFPILMRAFEESVRLNEPLEPTPQRIKEAMILEEIAETKKSSQDIPGELFPKAVKAIRRKHQPDPLDTILFEGVIHRNFARKTYQEVADELNKNKELRLIVKKKITEGLVRGRLNRMELPSKQLDTK